MWLQQADYFILTSCDLWTWAVGRKPKSVLAYVAQQAVNVFHWLTPGEMVNGLALAETTPGPLIMVVQFVAFLGATATLAPWIRGWRRCWLAPI